MEAKRKNVGASVRARLLERARAEKSDFQILLTRYVLERLLYRLSISQYHDRFILKGAMLFATWVDDPFRPTRDLDLLGRGDSELKTIETTFREVCETNADDDGVVFDTKSIKTEAIREDLKYGGVRVRAKATLDNANIAVQIDIGFGDAVTPEPVKIKYPVLLNNPSPELLAYPPETVVAEKFEALVSLGIANSRLKDFYDLWMISKTLDLSTNQLREAVRRTFERRATAMPEEVPVGLTDGYANQWSVQWRAFVGRERMAAVPENLSVVVADLREYLMPLTMSRGPKE